MWFEAGNGFFTTDPNYNHRLSARRFDDFNWRFDGSEEHCRRVARQLPLIAFRVHD